MIKKIILSTLIIAFICLNIFLDINIKNYISILSNCFNKYIYLSTKIYVLICFIIAFISIFCIIDMLLVFHKKETLNKGIKIKKEDGTFGTASWMEYNEVEKILSTDSNTSRLNFRYVKWKNCKTTI